MRKNLFRLALRGAIGFLLGLALWSGFSVPYTRLLASLSESVLRLGESPAITRITPQGTLMMIDRSDVRSPSAARLAVESTDITFNIVLLATLFAATGRALSDRNVFGFVCAAMALVLVHVAAVVSFVKAYYAENFGAWSIAHYGFVARHVWNAAPYFYSVVGAYGFAIALWWLLRPSPPPEPVHRSLRVAGHRRRMRFITPTARSGS